jgi:hypothetical protein
MIDKMASALQKAHKQELNGLTDEQKVNWYKRTYQNADMTSNEKAQHFYAFGCAFLGFNIQ